MSQIARACSYARVSTLLGQDPENQLAPIREFANARGFKLIDEYIDRGISGSRERRPGLDRLIRDARQGKFKILIVSAIDRVGRSTKHLLNLLDELNHYGVRLISLRENLDFTSPTGQMTLTVLSAVAQLERSIISERIKSALATKKLAAQQSGTAWRCGRPSVINDTVTGEVIALRKSGVSIREIERSLDRRISRSSIARILKENGLDTKWLKKMDENGKNTP